jgi:hypothetical protein
MKPEYPENSTDLSQVTDELHDMILYRVRLTTNWVRTPTCDIRQYKMGFSLILCWIISITYSQRLLIYLAFQSFKGRRGRDRMVVGYTTTCVISAYHPLKLWVRTQFVVRRTRYNIMSWSSSVTCDRSVTLKDWKAK